MKSLTKLGDDRAKLGRLNAGDVMDGDTTDNEIEQSLTNPLKCTISGFEHIRFCNSKVRT